MGSIGFEIEVPELSLKEDGKATYEKQGYAWTNNKLLGQYLGWDVVEDLGHVEFISAAVYTYEKAQELLRILKKLLLEISDQEKIFFTKIDNFTVDHLSENSYINRTNKTLTYAPHFTLGFSEKDSCNSFLKLFPEEIEYWLRAILKIELISKSPLARLVELILAQAYANHKMMFFPKSEYLFLPRTKISDMWALLENKEKERLQDIFKEKLPFLSDGKPHFAESIRNDEALNGACVESYKKTNFFDSFDYNTKNRTYLCEPLLNRVKEYGCDIFNYDNLTVDPDSVVAQHKTELLALETYPYISEMLRVCYNIKAYDFFSPPLYGQPDSPLGLYSRNLSKSPTFLLENRGAHMSVSLALTQKEKLNVDYTFEELKGALLNFTVKALSLS